MIRGALDPRVSGLCEPLGFCPIPRDFSPFLPGHLPERLITRIRSTLPDSRQLPGPNLPGGKTGNREPPVPWWARGFPRSSGRSPGEYSRSGPSCRPGWGFSWVVREVLLSFAHMLKTQEFPLSSLFIRNQDRTCGDSQLPGCGITEDQHLTPRYYTSGTVVQWRWKNPPSLPMTPPIPATVTSEDLRYPGGS